MREGDVVLTPVPQANGVIKNRPAIILREMPPYKDLLVCGVSTQVQHGLITHYSYNHSSLSGKPLDAKLGHRYYYFYENSPDSRKRP